MVVREPRYGPFGLIRGWCWVLAMHHDGHERILTPAERAHDRQMLNQWSYILGRRPAQKAVATFCSDSNVELGHELNPNFNADFAAALNRGSRMFGQSA